MVDLPINSKSKPLTFHALYPRASYAFFKPYNTYLMIYNEKSDDQFLFN